MYVRTNKGEIFDCIESEQMDKPIYYPKNSKTNGYIDYNEVYKKANNIIDICEVGDYVNGYRVIDFDYSAVNTRIRIWIDTENEMNYICKNEIKSIVTKEQFESMEYKVVE